MILGEMVTHSLSNDILGLEGSQEDLRVQGQPGPQSKFQDSKGYTGILF